MVFIPLIFFSVVLFAIVKRNGFDLSACITLMYVIISIFSAILGNYNYQFPYGNYSQVEIGVLPTFFYCFSIGLCIYPFYKFNSNKQRKLVILKNTQFLDILVYGYLFVLLFLVAVFWQDILFRIAFGDMDELRRMQYAGMLPNALDAKGGVARTIGGLCTIIGDGAYFLIPCFFYSLCALKKNKFYNFCILLGSVTPVLLGFIIIDRSKTAFWILLFVMSFFMFRPYIVSKEQKRFFKRVTFVVVGIMVFYLAMVTISRFGERDEGSSGGLLVYLGQPFINYCDIWENLNVDRFFLSRVMSLVTFMLYGSAGTMEVEDFIINSADRTGVHLNVFHTFVGTFLVDMGRIAAVIVPIFLFIVMNKIFGRYQKISKISLSTMIIVFAFGAILQCGIIVYFYTTVPRALAFWFFIWYSSRFLK